jgi:hypothetical protein
MAGNECFAFALLGFRGKDGPGTGGSSSVENLPISRHVIDDCAAAATRRSYLHYTNYYLPTYGFVLLACRVVVLEPPCSGRG